jgi:hypothetical protein
MKRVLQGLLLMAVTVALAACGPERKSVFPPTVSIQQLQVHAGGQWHLAVRIQNNSYGEMDFTALDGQLQLAALLPIRLRASFRRDIPALAGDVLELDVLPTAAMTQALQAIAGKGSAGSLSYRINGQATARPEQEKKSRDFDFSGTDWLSPVPGIPNTYR